MNFYSDYCSQYVDELLGIILFSHGPTSLVVLCLSLLVFRSNPENQMARHLVAFSFVFAIWSSLDLATWIFHSDPSLLMSSWAILDATSLGMFAIVFLMAWSLATGKPVPKKIGILVVGSIVIALGLSLSDNSITSFYSNDCVAIEKEWFSWTIYTTRAIYVFLSIFLLIKALLSKRTPRQDKTKILFFSFGLILFASLFLVLNIISDQTSDFRYDFYGLSTIVIFASSVVAMIIKFDYLNAKKGLGYLLVAVLLFGQLGSVLLPNENTTFTFGNIILSLIVSIVLIQSLNREIRELIATKKLSKNLETANLRLQELDKQKSEFVSLASHQLRGPVTGIKGYASMLQEGDYGKISPEVAEVLNRIQISAHDMAQLITGYLDISRIELGNIKYTREKFSLNDLVKEVEREISPDIPEKKVSLSVKLSEEPLEVEGDRNKIKQVVANFIDNAIKYTPKGKVEVTLSKSENMAHFEVKDDGLGISQSSLAGLFQKFARAQNASKSNIKGTGLGLYIAKSIVDYHKGNVSAKSDGEGKGSTFSFEIPLAL